MLIAWKSIIGCSYMIAQLLAYVNDEFLDYRPTNIQQTVALIYE
jgi:hypothetical protein